jgi:hypothetical protein
MAACDLISDVQVQLTYFQELRFTSVRQCKLCAVAFVPSADTQPRRPNENRRLQSEPYELRADGRLRFRTFGFGSGGK